MPVKDKKPDADRSAAKDKYIAKIDEFATMLRDEQDRIAWLAKDADDAKANYDRCKEMLREAKENEHNTISLLLKFVRPGSIELMPLFDSMEPADEAVHGEHSTEWRKEPITSLKLSAMAMRALIDADIVLVGQLQDRVLKGTDWANEFEQINDGMAQAIEAKLHAFIEERTGQK